MSTQFRSRIKSVVDYGTDLKNVGTCCFSDAPSKNLTFYECFSQSGTFFVGENVTCTDQGEIGTCYACAYLTASQKQQVIDSNGAILTGNTTWGTRQVTRCECTKIGGQFGVITDPNYPSRDIRMPKACCYFDYNANGFPIGITCENVCSEKECSLKGITYAPDPENPPIHAPVFTPDKLCSQVNCDVSNIQLRTYSTMVLGKNATTSFDIGPCYELKQIEGGYTYFCDLKMLHDCSGYWISPDHSEDIIMCDNPYKPQVPVKLDTRAIEPEVMSESAFDALNLSIGDEYKGGYYLGKYVVDENVYGSLNLTPPEERYYEDDSVRDESKKWAIIVDYIDYAFSVMDKGELDYSAPRTSNTDGFYNCYGNGSSFFGMNTKSMQTIVSTIKNGFADFYIPSINELYFIALSIKNNPDIFEKLSINNNLTSSSIFFENITSQKSKTYNFNGTVFTYGQNLNIDAFNFGSTVLVPGFQKSYIRLVRKIVLS